MKRNRYPDNPYIPGTMAAAHWDFTEALRRLGGVSMHEAKRDARRVMALLKRATKR